MNSEPSYIEKIEELSSVHLAEWNERSTEPGDEQDYDSVHITPSGGLPHDRDDLEQIRDEAVEIIERDDPRNEVEDTIVYDDAVEIRM